jgi:hypothetical protein
MITRTTRSTIHKTDPWIAIWALQFPNFSKSVYFFLSFQFHGRHVVLLIFNNFMLKSVSLPCFSPYPIELRHLIIAIRFFTKLRNVKSYVFYVKEPLSLPSVIRAVWSKKRRNLTATLHQTGNCIHNFQNDHKNNKKHDPQNWSMDCNLSIAVSKFL